MSYVISVLLIGFLIFVIVKNSISIVNKIKEKKALKNKDNKAVEVGGVDNLDSDKKENN